MALGYSVSLSQFVTLERAQHMNKWKSIKLYVLKNNLEAKNLF